VLVDSDFFDADWYLSRYPDVALSGMNPAEHYQWLGRRLGRSPGPAIRPVSKADVGHRQVAEPPNPNGNSAIAEALKRLCGWLFPDGERGCGIGPDQCYEVVANNFWNDESNGRTVLNPNGKLLVDFMRDFDLGPRKASKTSHRRVRKEPKSILLASYYAPSRSHAGGLRILDLYEEIRERHPSIRLTLFSSRNPKIDGDIGFLDSLFDEVFLCEPEAFSPRTLRELSGDLEPQDLVDLQFHQAGFQADGFREFGKSVIFTPMEVLSRADFDVVRKRSSEGHFPLEKFFSLIHRGAEEHRIMQSVDTTVCVSDADAAFLRSFSGAARVSYFPTGLSRREFGDQLRPNYKPLRISKRKNRLVFAAYFGSETNLAGLEWYLREVHPLVLAACPDYNLAVVGRGDTRRLEALHAPSVSFIGEVPSLSPVLEQCKAGLVLALHGSGFRGKINQYALCGLPSVSTSLGTTGLDYVDGEDILVGDTPEDFADKCIAILTKDKNTQRLSNAARKKALDNYTWAAVWPKIASIYSLS
jgi:glycosyltransferase involved in cell wall biosynthesis